MKEIHNPSLLLVRKEIKSCSPPRKTNFSSVSTICQIERKAGRIRAAASVAAALVLTDLRLRMAILHWLRGNYLHSICQETVVVLTRPPGCMQVHPDRLTRRLQPSSSKHGDISHHCRLRTIRRSTQAGLAPVVPAICPFLQAQRAVWRAMVLFGWLLSRSRVTISQVPATS